MPATTLSTYPRPAAASWVRRMPVRSLSSDRWTWWHPVALVVLVGLGVAATFDAWHDIFQTACNDEESSHIWLVPVIAAWLVWKRRGRVRRCDPGGLLLGPILILAGASLYLFGALYPLQSLWHAGAVLLLVGCVVSVLGKDTLVQLAPAFIVLLFLVPFPGRLRQGIAIPLEGIASRATQTCCEVFGMPVIRDGNDLKINGQSVNIAEACNGLRMAFSLTLVTYTIAFSCPLRNYVRVGMIVASPLLALVFNIIRLVPTVWVYGYFSRSSAEHFHDISGWLMPFGAFLVLLGVVRLFRWAMVPITRFTLAYK